MLYLRLNDREPGYFCLEEPVWLLLQRNGRIVRCREEERPGGVLSPDGEEIWHLAGRPSLGEGFPEAEEITAAEYYEWLDFMVQAPDPEDTEPVIPEGTDPATVLTRAELTQKVSELDEALHMLLSGVTEDG